MNFPVTSGTRSPPFALADFEHPSVSPKPVTVPETALRARIAKHDPTVIEVHARETKTVDIAPAQSATLFTCALAGGTFVVVLSARSDGSRSLTLSHYSPMLAEAPLSSLDHALSTTSHTSTGHGVQHELYVLVLGEFVEAPEGQPVWQARPDELKDVQTLESAVQAHLPDVHARVLPYRLGLISGQSDAFILTALPDTPVHYDGKLQGRCGF